MSCCGTGRCRIAFTMKDSVSIAQIDVTPEEYEELEAMFGKKYIFWKMGDELSRLEAWLVAHNKQGYNLQHLLEG